MGLSTNFKENIFNQRNVLRHKWLWITLLSTKYLIFSLFFKIGAKGNIFRMIYNHALISVYVLINIYNILLVLLPWFGNLSSVMKIKRRGRLHWRIMKWKASRWNDPGRSVRVLLPNQGCQSLSGAPCDELCCEWLRSGHFSHGSVW